MSDDDEGYEKKLSPQSKRNIHAETYCRLTVYYMKHKT